MCVALAHVCFGPIAYIGNDYDLSGSKAATRGKVTLISVHSPSCVSTSIRPACCLTMMSWLMERPRLVPSRQNCLVPCSGPDCTCSVVLTKLCVIIHNLAHQPFDQLLADRTVLAAS